MNVFYNKITGRGNDKQFRRVVISGRGQCRTLVEAQELGFLSSLLCTKEDPVLIESFVSQLVDPAVAASKVPKGLFKMRISRLSGSEL